MNCNRDFATVGAPAPDHQRLKGKRERALLALLLACGLRRHEAVALRLHHLQQQHPRKAINKWKVRSTQIP